MPRARTKPPPEEPQRTPKGAYAVLADKGYVARRDELGRLMGLSEAAVKHRLYGRTEFSAAELLALAEAIGVPPAAFFDRDFPFEEVLRRRQA